MSSSKAPTPPSPNILEWKHLRSPDFQKLDAPKTVVLVTCSPLEVHGPHLPMVTDIQEGESLIQRAVEIFCPRYPEIVYLRLPPIYVATDVVPQKGSLRFKNSTIIQVLKDLGRSLARQGFRHIWVSNFHGGPRHFLSIEMASHWVNRHYKTRMVSIFSLLMKRLTGGKNDMSQLLSHLPGVRPEDLCGDMHGGFIETSMMLHLLKKYVEENYSSLERRTIDLKLQEEGKPPVHEGGNSLPELFRRFKANLKYYESETYSGNPGAATEEMGRVILDTLAEMAAVALEELWTERIPLRECHTPLWPARWIFSNSFLGWLFEKISGHKSQIW